MSKPEVKPSKAEAAKLNRYHHLDKATKDDFFRLKQAGVGWCVEMVRIKDGSVVMRTDVYADDGYAMTERRLITYAADAERGR